MSYHMETLWVRSAGRRVPFGECTQHVPVIQRKGENTMEEKNQPRRPRRSPEENPQKNESLVYGKNPVTELLKSGSGVDTVLIAEGLAPAVAATIRRWPRRRAPRSSGCIPTSCA